MSAVLLTLFAGVLAGFCEEGAVGGALSLSPEERSFLSDHAPIRVGTMSNWPPLDYVDESGRPAGIGHDYLRALNGLLGDVLVAEPAPFSENYEKVKDGRMDALMDITPREDREPFFEFTKPYLSVPHVIIGRKDGLYFSSEEALKGKTVALEKGYYNVVVFRENFPDVQIREYGSTSDALDAVARGEADAYAGNRAVAIYLIEKELLGNLQPQGRLNTPPIDLAIGVRKDRPMLAAILDRALKAIPAGERDKINARYVSSVFEPWFASRYFWTVVAASLGAVLLVGLLGMLWTRTLKRMVETRTRQFIREHKERLRAEESLGESERRYLTLFENAGDAIFLMSRDRFVECNARALALFGCNQQDIIGASPYRFSPELQPDGRASGEKALEMIDRALTEGAQFFEWVHCRMDGEPFDAEVMLNRLDLGREVFLQAVVRDITERKRSQEQLKEYSQNLERMVEDRTRELDEARAEMFSQAKL
ncbi:MAG TPA: transporter substrate-binding domain-containing protein, partial [bacterium]|nr:transporter substrate-binding domain-containing protein [bacterium]